MIKKIINWVFGSFFRTMGRFFFFLFFGFLLACIISRSNLNINWTDLLGIETVSALTYTTEVQVKSSSYFDIRNASSFTCDTWDSCQWELVSSDSNPIQSKQIQINSNYNTRDKDFIAFQILLSQPVQIVNSDSNTVSICSRWLQNGNTYTCDQVSGVTDNDSLIQESILSDINFNIKANYTNNNSAFCDINGNQIICPTFKNQIDNVEITWNFKTHYTSYALFRFYKIANNIYYANTVDAIENQTQQYIQAQENATQQQIESQQVCQQIDVNSIKKVKVGLGQTGQETNWDTYGITDYINIFNSKVKVIETQPNGSAYTCFYNVNKTLISCIRNLDLSGNITLPNGSYYMIASINRNTNKPQFEICQNGNQALNNYLNDDSTSGAESSASNFFSNFTDSDNGGIRSIITAPLTAISGLVNSTCQQIELPIPYLDNSNIVLPCMSSIYTEHFGSFFTIYQTIIFGAIAYRMLVSIFMMIQGFKNPDDDKIEVVDL